MLVTAGCTFAFLSGAGHSAGSLSVHVVRSRTPSDTCRTLGTGATAQMDIVPREWLRRFVSNGKGLFLAIECVAMY